MKTKTKRKSRDMERFIEWLYWRETHAPWSRGMSTRAWNCLERRYDMSKMNRRNILGLLGDGSYETYRYSELRKLRDFGWRTWQGLCQWAGLPVPERPRPIGRVQWFNQVITNAYCKEGRVWLETKHHTFVWNGAAFDQVD